MGNVENRVQPTRKRPPSSQSLPSSSSTKRVALGELTNLPKSIRNPENSNKTIPLLNDNVPSSIITGTESTHQDLTELTTGRVLEFRNSSFSSSSSLYGYLHSLEVKEDRRILSCYMDEVQTDVSVGMREILVDWLVEVAEEYKLVSDTLYLTISYIDRFLSSKPLNRSKLQLLGVSCMLIALKYEEISPPHVEDFCYITDNTYTKEEVVNMEKDVLAVLNFEMSSPTVTSFLRILTKAAQDNSKSPDLEFEFLCCYIVELSLLDYRCVHFLPSLVAASAVFLARFMIQPMIHPWSQELQCLSGYRPCDLKACALNIHDYQLNRKGSSLTAISDKYQKHQAMQFGLAASDFVEGYPTWLDDYPYWNPNVSCPQNVFEIQRCSVLLSTTQRYN